MIVDAPVVDLLGELPFTSLTGSGSTSFTKSGLMMLTENSSPPVSLFLLSLFLA